VRTVRHVITVLAISLAIGTTASAAAPEPFTPTVVNGTASVRADEPVAPTRAPASGRRDRVKSSPPDHTVHRASAAAAARAKAAPAVSPAGVFVIDATAAASSAGGNEPSIAVNPADPNEIAITRFNTSWNNNADLLYSTNGGITWTNETTIPRPPGIAGTAGCPCDQTIDYGRDGTLYGTFLTCTPATPPATGCASNTVVTGSTSDPTSAASWSWNGNPAQLTSGTRTNTDQPWLLVNRDSATATQDNVYVGYDDMAAGPDARVAVSTGTIPVNIVRDAMAGTESPLATNPGLRLATDPRNGTVYALYEQSTGSTQPKSVTYRLNRSTDAGVTWTLNGNTNGLIVDTVNSDQAPGFKFGTVNALLGGVDHAAVDPTNGDVYVAYGQDVSGGNRINIRRLTANGTGGLTVGPAVAVSTSTDAALPSVAVLSDGTVGVLYDTYDGNTAAGFPIFSAHLARSTNQGATFTDVVLQTFQSPVTSSSNARQRVLGDFHQLKAVGNTFYGAFAGNTSGVPATGTPPINAIFFSVPQHTQTTLTSSANPSVYGQPVTFTATVQPVPDGGTVTFTVDGTPLGAPVPVNTTTGQAVSASITTLSPGAHTVTAAYSGNDNFAPSTAPPLTQVVQRAPVVTTITSSANPALFGQPVTLTDTVCPSGASTAPAAPPTGTVTIADGSVVLGTPTLAPGGGTNCSQASLTTTNLLPGVHSITATYSGDANYLPGGVEHLSQTVGCSRTITGRVNGAIHVSGQSICVINADVHGAIVGHTNTAVFIGNSSVRGSINLTRPAQVAICGTQTTGSVHVIASAGFVVIGDPGDDNCAVNRIGGAVQVRHNRGGLELVGNTIGGSLLVTDNSGAGPFPEDSAVEIEDNTIGGALNCSGNVPPPTNDGQPNDVSPRQGQCTTL
jgi:hypothetical protein